MPMEPLSLFGRELDRAAVVRRMRELADAVRLDVPRDDGWFALTATWGRLWGKKTLILHYDPAHCSGENWARQMDGMRGYYARFPDTPRKERVMMLTHTFGFTLGARFDPDAAGPADPRVQALFDLARLLDGVVFSPSRLLDAHGRVLFAAGGAAEEDADAAWPRVIYTVQVTPSAASDGGDADEDDADPEATAPSAGRVAIRALALVALTARAMLEWSGDDPGTGLTHENVLEWARETGAMDEMEPEEREVMQAPLRSLAPQPHVNAAWRLEGVAVLAWALGLADLPPHDRVTQPDDVWDHFGFLDVDAARAILAAPVLRPRDEIAALRQRLFALHWRLRDWSLRPTAMDFAEFAATAWFGPLDITGVPLVDGDVALGGARIDQADPELFARVHSAAQERHLAVNWLWEGPELYSDADVST